MRVLLLEAGGRCVFVLLSTITFAWTLITFLSALKNPLVRTPSGFTLIFETPLVFNLFTTPQQGSGDRAHYWPRGEHAIVPVT